MNQIPSSPNARLVLAADLGGTHLRVALVGDCGQIHAQLKQETPKGDSPDYVIGALAAAAEQFGYRAGLTDSDVIAASIAVPGTVNRAGTMVLQAPNLPALSNFELRAALEDRFGFPVVLENDANAAAVGEMWLGAARGCSDVICVTLGTGVGGGIIVDGKLVRGAHGSAGEIGHTTVDPFGGLKCKCGNTGCLEMFASATAIVRLTKEALPEFPETTLTGEHLSAAQVYEAGISGDKLALAVFERLGSHLGIGLANLINLLDPEIIVIGGGVANGWRLFAPQMLQQVSACAFQGTGQDVRIVPAGCGDNAGLLGAARLGFDEEKARQDS